MEADGEERIFRLYFVDTPEAESGGYVTERVSEQAAEFGITEEESVEMGKKAAAFTRAVLSRPFKVTTRGQNALGASQLKREYAFVETADGEDLGEMLVSRGLARSFGEDAAFGTKKASDLRAKYDRLEAQARREKLGAWGDDAATPTRELGGGHTGSLDGYTPPMMRSETPAEEPERPVVADESFFEEWKQTAKETERMAEEMSAAFDAKLKEAETKKE